MGLPVIARERPRPAICAGYILRSEHAIGWRLGVIKGRFDPRKVSDGGHHLFANYRAMAIANGVAEDDPIIAPCRP